MASKHLHAFSDDALGNDDATALAERLRGGHVSTREVTEAAIARLQRVEPSLHGLTLDTFDAARQRAESKRFNGFFAGVPSLIKDNIDPFTLDSYNCRWRDLIRFSAGYLHPFIKSKH